MLSKPPGPITPVSDWKILVMPGANDITYCNSTSAVRSLLFQGTSEVALNPAPPPRSGLISNWLAWGPTPVRLLTLKSSSVHEPIVHPVAPSATYRSAVSIVHGEALTCAAPKMLSATNNIHLRISSTPLFQVTSDFPARFRRLKIRSDRMLVSAVSEYCPV